MAIGLTRLLGAVPLEVVVREIHTSTLRITTNPVEKGADVTDHAFIEPKQLTLEAVTRGSNLNEAAVAATYQALLKLQETREPFSLVTGLTVYRNMLIETLEVDRDKSNSRLLFFTADLVEILLVDTQSSPGQGGAKDAKGSKSQSATSKGSLAKGSTATRASPSVDRGNVTAPTVDISSNSPAAATNQGFLRTLLGESGGTVKAGPR